MRPKEVELILSTLRRILKKKNMTYAVIAQEIGVTEVTIKRFFTGDDVSLKRLLQICDAVDMTLADVMTLALGKTENTFTLTEDQEQFLAENEDTFYFFTLLLEGMGLSQLKANYHLSDSQIQHFLQNLEQLDLLEMLPCGSYRLRVKGLMAWQKNGLLQKKYMEQRHIDYVRHFSSSMNCKDVFLTSSERKMTIDSLNEMVDDFKFLIKKYRNRANREETVRSSDKLIPVSWIIGVGPFQRDTKAIFHPN